MVFVYKGSDVLKYNVTKSKREIKIKCPQQKKDDLGSLETQPNEREAQNHL